MDLPDWLTKENALKFCLGGGLLVALLSLATFQIGLFVIFLVIAGIAFFFLQQENSNPGG